MTYCYFRLHQRQKEVYQTAEYLIDNGGIVLYNSNRMKAAIAEAVAFFEEIDTRGI